jgi:phytoene/squalene synthetase
MSDSTALDSFLEKWRTRWPEWRVVEVFVPASQRQLAVAWFALLQEFADAMNIVGDPLPADAKLMWWGEELRDWGRQRSRHPLGRVLEPQGAPWHALAETLPALIEARAKPASGDAAFAQLAQLASAIVQVELALFQVISDDAPAQAQAISAQLLAARLEQAGSEALPADAGDQRALSELDWARALQLRWPISGGAAPRRLWSALARSRLRRFQGTGEGIAPLPPARALWLGWRAARRG